MKINPQDIRDGKCTGLVFWIVDYRYNNIFDKPIRNVKPTKVIVRSDADVNVRAYYSTFHFAPLKQDGTPYKKVIKLYDNTGYRSFTGEPVNIYETKEECYEKYREQLLIVKEQLEEKRKEVDERLKEIREEFMDNGICISVTQK